MKFEQNAETANAFEPDEIEFRRTGGESKSRKSNIARVNIKPHSFTLQLLQSLGAPHVASFNFMTDGGLEKAIADIPPVHFELPNGDRLCLKVEGAAIAKPHFPAGTVIAKDLRIFPKECRQRVASYRGRLTVQFSWSVNDRDPNVVTKDLGDIPIMVKVG